MNGELAVLKILLSNATVTDLVSNRVFLNEAPQGKELPYIIIEEEDVEPFPTKSGASSKDHDTIRVYPYSASQNQLRELYVACRNALDEYTGELNIGDVDTGIITLEVERIRYQGQTSFNDELENRKVYAKDQQYLVRIAV
jgi:hypothetical protein